jgi:hypothetical protein
MLAVLTLLSAFGILVESHGQVYPPDPFPTRRDRETDPELPKSVAEGIAKQQIDRSVKEHEELLERGDEALLLTEKIDFSLEKNGTFTPKDIENLERLEKVVVKIRNDLGGDSDSEADDKIQKEISKNTDLVQTFQYLRSSTEKLVSELKKTTRHSISVVAIQASNSVIKVARFLRLRK